jgi:hypothetical protein
MGDWFKDLFREAGHWGWIEIALHGLVRLIIQVAITIILRNKGGK